VQFGQHHRHVQALRKAHRVTGKQQHLVTLLGGQPVVQVVKVDPGRVVFLNQLLQQRGGFNVQSAHAGFIRSSENIQA